MKNKKNVIALVITAILILLVYLIVGFTLTEPEIQLMSKWTFSINDEAKLSENNEILVPFRLGNTLGYFTPEGNFSYKYQVNTPSSISSDYWTLVNNAKEFTISSPDGSSTVKVPSQGKPFLSNENLFLFNPGGASFTRYNFLGEKMWTCDGYVPITCFSSSDYGTVAGYADGEVRCLTPNGEIDFSMYPGGSTYPVIFGVDISDSGNDVACISGLDSQRFVLIRRSGNQHKIVFHEYLTGEVKEPVYIHFTNNGRYVYYDYVDYLGVLDCEKLTAEHLKIPGKILKIAEIPYYDVIFVLSKNETVCTLTVIEGMANIIGSYDYQADSTFISALGDSLFVGIDDKISCIQVIKK